MSNVRRKQNSKIIVAGSSGIPKGIIIIIIIIIIDLIWIANARYRL
jgi:hypothetical protein